MLKTMILALLSATMMTGAIHEKKTKVTFHSPTALFAPDAILSLHSNDTLGVVTARVDSSFTFTAAAGDTLVGVICAQGMRCWNVILDGEPLEIAIVDGLPVVLKGSKANRSYFDTWGRAVRAQAVPQTLKDEEERLNAQYGEEVPERLALDLAERQGKAVSEAVRAVCQKPLRENRDNMMPALLISDVKQFLDTDSIESYLSTYKYKNHSVLRRVVEGLSGEKAKRVGAAFIDFETTDIKGEKRSLSDYVGRGNYTLVDFWASWCGPCRAEMPTVKAAYEKYRAKGLQVVGISLDGNRADWEKAVNDLGLDWPQLCDLKGSDCQAAKLYNVSAIPFCILYDGEGKVVATDLRRYQLTEKLQELYGE